MRDTIEALIELQRVDDEIRGHKLQRDELAANLERLRTILSRMAAELEEKRQKLAEATRFYVEKQGDLTADGDRLGRAKVKLAAVTRTKEYTAVQKELDSLRRKFTDDETELKRLAEAIEEYKATISQEEAKLRDLEAEVSREEAASHDRLRELDQEIAEIEGRKKEIRVRLKPGDVSRYERILARREGKAVVPAAEGKCTGCQIRLPPQLFIMVQRWQTLECCPSCQRFLFWTDDVPLEVMEAG